MIWDGEESPTADPQITHKLFRSLFDILVNKMCINGLLLGCNFSLKHVFRLCSQDFLPTMKFQLSQLPKDCWFRARHYQTRPFFLSVCFNSIT